MGLQILNDARYMLKAIDEAISGVYENGLDYGAQVGCVIVGQDGAIISKAHNSPNDSSRMHAEEIAIKRAGGYSSGTTLYVTVEPCNGNPYHTRRHCCERIIDAGIRRVVIGTKKRVYEGGADHMSELGVEVETLKNDDIGSLCILLMANSKNGAGLSKKVVNRVIEIRYQIENRLWGII